MPVVDPAGELVGIFTLQDLDRVLGDDHDLGTAVGDVCTRKLLVAYPDEAIGAALRRIGSRGIGRLPVVDRIHPRRLLGILTRADLMRAYDAAVTRRATLRDRASQVRLGVYSGANAEEFTVAPGAACAGKQVRDLEWPQDCVIATVRRRGEIIIPHGDTVIQAGDVLVAVVAPGSRAGVASLCGHAEPPA
jgi:CIC family chloride channel protein